MVSRVVSVRVKAVPEELVPLAVGMFKVQLPRLGLVALLAGVKGGGTTTLPILVLLRHSPL